MRILFGWGPFKLMIIALYLLIGWMMAHPWLHITRVFKVMLCFQGAVCVRVVVFWWKGKWRNPCQPSTSVWFHLLAPVVPTVWLPFIFCTLYVPHHLILFYFLFTCGGCLLPLHWANNVTVTFYLMEDFLSLLDHFLLKSGGDCTLIHQFIECEREYTAFFPLPYCHSH